MQTAPQPNRASSNGQRVDWPAPRLVRTEPRLAAVECSSLGRMKELTLQPVMNNTKWEALRLVMYGLGNMRPLWRTKSLETGYVTKWDGEWFYHFKDGGYESIEWLEIDITSPEQDEVVSAALKAIHVPGHRTERGFRVFGYAPNGVVLDYI